MSISKRKIGFYSLKIEKISDEATEESPTILRDLISKILKVDEIDRIYDIKRSNKFHLLKSSAKNGTAYNLVFESAKYYHRPPLVDKDTALSRDNPKELTEGELENTHIALKYNKDEIILLLEERTVGISIGVLVTYFNLFFNRLMKDEDKSYRMDYSIIPKGDFLKELEKLERVRFGNIYVDKQIIGSEFLNFSNRIETLQDEIVLTIKAKKKHSMKDTIRTIANKFFAQDSRISKIRVYGFSKEGNQVLLDTDIVKMIEYVEVDLDSATGIVDSKEIFHKLNGIIK